MRRLVWCAVAVAAACGSETKRESAPLTRIREPTGIAVHDRRVLVLSSNADLTYDEATGGTLLSLGVDPQLAVSVVGGVRVHSMGGDLAVARTAGRGANVPDGEACGSSLAAPLAVFGNRGVNTVNAVSIAPATGELTCAGCGIPAGGAGFGDPFPVAVACSGGRARAFFGYVNSQGSAAWIGELDLATLALRNALVGAGAVRGFAYDRDRDRLFMTGNATGTPTPLRWVDLAGCTLGLDVASGGCTVGAASLPIVTGSYAVELHYVALAPPAAPGTPRPAAEPIRAYLTGTLYDQATAAPYGYRTTGFGSVLVVADLYDDARGGVRPVIAGVHDVPAGARDVRVLPRPAGWTAGRRDVVAVVSVDTGSLTILDDETGTMSVFGLDATGADATGGPVLGHQAYGLGVDPEIDGATAHLWIGSFADGYVTPVDVTLDPEVAATFAGGSRVKITGATK